eukprot:TRINITY_DN1479_c0_g3_i1.p1 TRINITY_DN1479_c0_g3~~TRINITY_DN1479_c0_g3_i1.p1  ORF type:complete len:118 (+),score=12.37 TRINITY_DN1479_c0_g3_i1:230-583(+)
MECGRCVAMKNDGLRCNYKAIRGGNLCGIHNRQHRLHPRNLIICKEFQQVIKQIEEKDKMEASRYKESDLDKVTKENKELRKLIESLTKKITQLQLANGRGCGKKATSPLGPDLGDD